jgi:GT2 family glycosyltransferase
LIAKCSEIEYGEYADRLIQQGPYVVMQALNTSNCLFRRSILETVDGFDVNLPFCEDSEIGYRIWHAKGKIVFVYPAKCTNTHRSRFRDKLKQSWEFGLGTTYIKRKHPQFPIRWEMYLLLPYSVTKRILTWGTKYGWIGSIASIIYFFKRTSILFGHFYSLIFGIHF